MTDIELKTLKDNLWHSADMLRAGAHLAANKYGQPILGLIFLRYADILFKQHKQEIDAEYQQYKGTRIITMYLPDHNPPHFHVRYNEFRATIDIQTGQVTGQLPRRALNLVFDWLDLHKDELMANWQRMENGETLATINPLD